MSMDLILILSLPFFHCFFLVSGLNSYSGLNNEWIAGCTFAGGC